MSPLKFTTRKRDPINPSAEETIHITPYTAILRNKRRTPPGVSSIAEWLAVVQGLYYGVKGLWPFVSLSTFLAVTAMGPEGWGLYAASLLTGVIGIVFGVAALRSVLTFELGLLMIGCSFGLGFLDAVYFLKGGRSPFLFFDGAVEITAFTLAIFFLPYFTHRRHSTYL